MTFLFHVQRPHCLQFLGYELSVEVTSFRALSEFLPWDEHILQKPSSSPHLWLSSSLSSSPLSPSQSLFQSKYILRFYVQEKGGCWEMESGRRNSPRWEAPRQIWGQRQCPHCVTKLEHSMLAWHTHEDFELQSKGTGTTLKGFKPKVGQLQSFCQNWPLAYFGQFLLVHNFIHAFPCYLWLPSCYVAESCSCKRLHSL